MGRPILFVGADNDEMQFSALSNSRPGLEHPMRVDKRTGWMECFCEDAQYRKERRRVHVLEPNADTGCQHLRQLHTSFGEIIHRKIDIAIAA